MALSKAELEGDRQVREYIHPTHECFTDAMDVLVDMLTTRQVPPEELKLVHGICRIDSGDRYAHAWVERGTNCYFVGLWRGEKIIGEVPRQDYYQHLCVLERTTYTVWHAARENQRTTSYGPWKPAYRALCRPPLEEQR